MIIRLMGEIEIHTYTSTELSSLKPQLSALQHKDDLSAGDIQNWLGFALDNADSGKLATDDDWRQQIEQAGIFLASRYVEEAANDAFILLLILREKWPVGSKARFKAIADRVGANHTYLVQASPVQSSINGEDKESLSQAETQSLRAMIPELKKCRKQFANSSGLQHFLKNLS